MRTGSVAIDAWVDIDGTGAFGEAVEPDVYCRKKISECASRKPLPAFGSASVDTIHLSLDV